MRWFREALDKQASMMRDVRLKEVSSLDKAMALLSVKDPISYQAVEAMTVAGQYASHYDPSDEGEITRIHDREGDRDGVQEQMNDAQRDFLDDFFPGAS